MNHDEIRAAGAAWMRASLTAHPLTEEQKRRIRVLLTDRRTT